MANKEQTQAPNIEPEYTREEILQSSRYKGVAGDLLGALLSPDRSYTLKECDTLLRKEERREII